MKRKLQKNSDLKNGKIHLKFKGDLGRLFKIIGTDHYFSNADMYVLKTHDGVICYEQSGIPKIIPLSRNRNKFPLMFSEKEIMTEVEEIHKIKKLKEKIQAVFILAGSAIIVGIAWLIGYIYFID